MKKAYSKSSRQGLPGGPNEMFQKVKGIIVSERGQWDFPGMTTLVPTQDGRITMRGVPYPVLGQDETGYTQMMYPEQEYQFPGQNVLELPMAQNGLSTPIINLPEYTVIDEKIPENIRLANTAKRLVEELYDVSRPAAGFTEKISDLFIPGEKKYYDNTCVKGVCDIFKEANLNSGIPEDVLNNKDFLENYSKYGFTLVPNEQLQVGDIIQYYEKDRPTHLGIYVGDDEYVGDGSKDKPLVKSNIHKYPDGKDKLPFRAFRKNFKSGGSLPKAQNGPPTYSDSLELYKNTVALENFLRSKNATVPKDKFRRWQWEDSQPLVGTNPARNWYTLNPNLSDREKALSYANSLYNVDKSTGSKSLPKSHYIKTQNNLIGTRDWAPEGEDDKDFPVSYIHPQIKPQFEGDVDDMSGVAGSFYMYRYDPIAIKPGALLTPKELAIRLKKYGKRGIPQSKVDEYYASKKPVTTSAAPPVALPVTPKKEFVRNINQFPFKNPATGKTEDRVSLITPAHQYIMNLSQYSKLLPTDSIPQKGNFLYRTNYKKNGGALPKAQMLGQFNPQLFQPNPLTGRYNWEKPKAKPQLRDFEPKQKAAERSSTNVATKPDPIKAARQINATAAEEYERNRGVIRNAPVRASSYFKPGGYDPTPLAEYTGVPSMVRIAQNPESINDFLTGVDQLILGSSPVSGMMGLRREFTPEEIQAMSDYGTVAAMAAPLAKGAVNLGAQGLRQAGRYATTQTPLRNAWRLNPNALKNPDLILTRTQKPGQTLELKRLEELKDWGEKYGFENMDPYSLMEYESLSKPGYGRGFSSDLMHIDYYSNPYVQGTRGYEGLPEILKIRLPAKEAAKFNVKLNPLEGYESYAPGKEFLLPEDLVYSAESFIPTKRASYGPGTISNITRTLDKEQKLANTPHWWKGYQQVEVPRQLPGSPNAGRGVKSGNVDLRLWNIFNKKKPEPFLPPSLNAEAELARANADALAFSQSPYNKAKLQKFRPGQDFNVTNTEALFHNDPLARERFAKLMKDDPDFLNYRNIENWQGVAEGSYGARNFGDMDDLAIVNKNKPQSKIYNAGIHETGHSRSVRLPATKEERAILDDAWGGLKQSDGSSLPVLEAEAVQGELRMLLGDKLGKRVYTKADEGEIKTALEKMIADNHPYMQNINDFDISKIIKSLNKIGLASVVGIGAAGAAGANQLMNQQPESYQGGGSKLKPYGMIEVYPGESGTGVQGDVGLSYDLPTGTSTYLSNQFTFEPGYGSFINPGFGIEQSVGDRGSAYIGANMFDNRPMINAGIKYRFDDGGSLPKAQVGKYIPSWLNPMNWGVEDYTDKYKTWDEAYAAAKKAGLKEIMWNKGPNPGRKNLDYAGTPRQEMRSYGITGDQKITGVKKVLNPIRKNLANLRTEFGYDIPLEDVFDVARGKKENAFRLLAEDLSNDPLSHASKEQDALRLYMGLPQKGNAFTPSRYREGAFELSGYNELLPDVLPSDEFISHYGQPLKREEYPYYELNTEDKKAGVDNVMSRTSYIKPFDDMVMGRHTVSKRKDDRGEYLEYIDYFDFDTYEYPLDIEVPFTDKKVNVEISLGKMSDLVNKPFNIYGRKYYKDYGDGVKKAMYYTDKELSQLDPKKKNFDTLALQRELSNRGYKLPESTKQDGTFDGIFGDETKDALKDWQKKNSKKQFGGSLPTAGDPVLNFIQSQSPRFSKSKK